MRSSVYNYTGMFRGCYFHNFLNKSIITHGDRYYYIFLNI